MKSNLATLNIGLAIALSSSAMDADNAKPLLELHNQARASGHSCASLTRSSSPPLIWSSQLAAVAELHAKAMAEQKKLSHNIDASPRQRLARARYRWSAFAENIAAGVLSAASANAAWLQSKRHCTNLMDREFTEMGAAEQNGYWVVVFARPLER